MIPYVLLILGLLSAVFLKRRKQKAILSFFVIATFSAVRYGMSYDYNMYVAWINNGWFHHEPLSAFLEYLAGNYLGVQSFFIISSFLVTFFVLLSIYKSSPNVMMSVFFYVGMPFFFVQDMSTVRQAMGTCLILYLISLKANSAFQERSTYYKLFLSVGIVLVAYMFHSSAIVGLLVLFPFEKISKKIMVLGILSSLFIGIVMQQFLVSFIANHLFAGHLGGKLEEYVSKEMSGMTLFRLLVYFLTLVSYLKYDKLVKINPNNRLYLNFMGLGVIIMSLFMVSPHMGFRLCLFFWTPGLFVIPTLWRVFSLNRSVFRWVCIVIFAFTIYSYQNFVDKNNDRLHYFYPFVSMFSDKATYDIYRVD